MCTLIGLVKIHAMISKEVGFHALHYVSEQSCHIELTLVSIAPNREAAGCSTFAKAHAIRANWCLLSVSMRCSACFAIVSNT